MSPGSQFGVSKIQPGHPFFHKSCLTQRPTHTARRMQVIVGHSHAWELSATLDGKKRLCYHNWCIVGTASTDMCTQCGAYGYSEHWSMYTVWCIVGTAIIDLCTQCGACGYSEHWSMYTVWCIVGTASTGLCTHCGVLWGKSALIYVHSVVHVGTASTDMCTQCGACGYSEHWSKYTVWCIAWEKNTDLSTECAIPWAVEMVAPLAYIWENSFYASSLPYFRQLKVVRSTRIVLKIT